MSDAVIKAPAGPAASALWGRLGRAPRLGLAAAAGFAMFLSMPPRGWWVLLPLGVALLAVAVFRASWRGRSLVGGVAGLTYFGPGLFWLTSFHAVGYVAVAAVEVAMFAASVVLVPARRGGWWLLPAALVVLEAARTHFPFGGFPLPALALGQVDGPFATVAGLGGSLLVTGIAAVAGIVLAAPLLARRRVRATAAAGFLVATVMALSAFSWTRPAGTVDVTVVQGGGLRGVPAIFSDLQEVTERNFAASERIGGSPDVVLWPEGALHLEQPLSQSAENGRLAALARELDTTLVAGVVEAAGEGFRNSAVAWTPDGSRVGRYEKVHRVPFGEYIPLRGVLERISDATALVQRDAVPGRGPGLLRTPAGPLGVAISYEVFFPARARAAANAGGRILLVPTNAASYTSEDVPSMEIAAARLRARELDRAVAQAAPTGYSAIVRPDGQVVRQSRLEKQAVLAARAPLREGHTPYARTGDWPVLSLSLLALLSFFLMRSGAALREYRTTTGPAARNALGPAGVTREDNDPR